MRRTPKLIVNEEPWKGPMLFRPVPTPGPVCFYELLDDDERLILESIQMSAICREIRRRPAGTLYVLRRWESPGALDALHLGRQWLAWLGSDGRIRTLPIRRYWPLDPH